MREVKTYKCECCGIEFFNHSGRILNKEKKSFSCPFCESELLCPLKAK
jgi:hypothetical protein